ncbi:MAG: hypothetical protein J6W04_02285 [Bacteroidales bacterium]|nr:hypothetical protein [Bacteroidales bacterium]
MGGSASYRLAKKIANARANGASQDEIDELERQRQVAKEAERAKRAAKRAENRVLIPEGGYVPPVSDVNADEYAGPIPNQQRQTEQEIASSVTRQAPVVTGGTSARSNRRNSFDKLNKNQKQLLNSIRRKLRSGNYASSDFNRELRAIAKALDIETEDRSLMSITMDIESELGISLG